MKTIDRSRVRKILIRAVNWIGDAVMTTPAVDTVRANFPEAEITVLANEAVSEVFRVYDGVDRVITFHRNGRHKGALGRLRLAAELRRSRFDLAVMLPNSFDAALVPWLAGIPQRVGKDSDARSIILTHRFPRVLLKPDTHQVLNYLTMLEYFGLKPSPAQLRLQTSAAEDAEMDALLAARGIAPGEFVLGVNPGATYGSAKRWYPERFAETARELAKRWGARVIITGGPGETEMAGKIAELLEGDCADFAGKTSVRQLMALIKRCNFFITNDSGPMHIAAAFDVPLVAIFGPTDHRTTSAFFERGAIVRRGADCAPCMKRECPIDHRCMTAVTAGDVIEAADGLYHRLGLGKGGR
ncbi:lipopolysaccharide heptosyltransferase II [Geomonas oryzae]|uniref:lipopolysaccharide heptosyltransferase II n=1 Tax=Geomonas oryzae TaxID=2364273 RepID=UPI00100A6023|nr:lipopolysaccharide heptosyltransferase II [Geomonas oryzae]